eukprot:g7732.t1
MSSGNTVKLHPLLLLNLSDQVTRLRANANCSPTPSSSSSSNLPSYCRGVLLGAYSDKKETDIFNSFELPGSGLTSGGGIQTSSGDDPMQIVDDDDPDAQPLDLKTFFEKRRKQYAEVFPTLESVGFYVIAMGGSGGSPAGGETGRGSSEAQPGAPPTSMPPGSGPMDDEIFQRGQYLLQIQVGPNAVFSLKNVRLFERVVAAGGLPQLQEVKEFQVASVEAERIATQHVVSASSSQSGVNDHAKNLARSVAMLRGRIDKLIAFLKTTAAPLISRHDHDEDAQQRDNWEIVREIQLLCQQLGRFEDFGGHFGPSSLGGNLTVSASSASKQKKASAAARVFGAAGVFGATSINVMEKNTVECDTTVEDEGSGITSGKNNLYRKAEVLTFLAEMTRCCGVVDEIVDLEKEEANKTVAGVFAFSSFLCTLGAAHAEVDNGSAHAAGNGGTISRSRSTPPSSEREVLSKSRATPDSSTDVLPLLMVDSHRTIAEAGAFSSMLTTGEQRQRSAGLSKRSSSDFLYDVSDFSASESDQGPGSDYPAYDGPTGWERPFDHNENDSNNWPGSCSHSGDGTGADNHAYWYVQFAKVDGVVPKKHVDKVRLWNRGNGFAERLNKACVRYSYDENRPSNANPDEDCDDYLAENVDSSSGSESGTWLPIDKKITGIMFITRALKKPITICGIEIYKPTTTVLYDVSDFNGIQGPGTDEETPTQGPATWDRPFDHTEFTPNEWPNKCSHSGAGTGADNHAYWYVQFTRNACGVVPKKHVLKVRLWNRAGCCPERLNNACVRYSYDGTRPSNANPDEDCDDYLPVNIDSSSVSGSGTEFPIDKEITGMMFITRNPAHPMTICGIEIYKPTTATTTTTSATCSVLYDVADFTGSQGPGDYGDANSQGPATWDRPFDHTEFTPNGWPNKCSHTGDGTGADNPAYWFVQFANSGGVVPKKHVLKVRLWNRAGYCDEAGEYLCAERLNGACVRYSYDGSTPSKANPDADCDDELPATVDSRSGVGSGTELMIDKKITGMMFIAKNATDPMTICGIEISYDSNADQRAEAASKAKLEKLADFVKSGLVYVMDNAVVGSSKIPDATALADAVASAQGAAIGAIEENL